MVWLFCNFVKFQQILLPLWQISCIWCSSSEDDSPQNRATSQKNMTNSSSGWGYLLFSAELISCQKGWMHTTAGNGMNVKYWATAINIPGSCMWKTQLTSISIMWVRSPTVSSIYNHEYCTGESDLNRMSVHRKINTVC